MTTEYLKLQIASTKALVKFIQDHKGIADKDLLACLKELENKNIQAAIQHAKMVKPHGMGGITDWFPQPLNEQETNEYNDEVLRSLVNEWCRVISLSFEVSDTASRTAQKGELDAPVKQNGAVLCAFCGKTFSSKDSVSWDGSKHTTCGVRLKLFPVESFDAFRNA